MRTLADLEIALAAPAPLRFDAGHPLCIALGLPAEASLSFEDWTALRVAGKLRVAGRLADGGQTYSVPPLGADVQLTVTSVSAEFAEGGAEGLRATSVPTAATLSNGDFSVALTTASAVPPPGGFALSGQAAASTLDTLATDLGLANTSLAGCTLQGAPSISFAGVISGVAILGLQLAVEVPLTATALGDLSLGAMTAMIFAGGSSDSQAAPSALRFGWSIQTSLPLTGGQPVPCAVAADPLGWRLSALLPAGLDPGAVATQFFPETDVDSALSVYGAASWTADRLELVFNTDGSAVSGSLVATGWNGESAQLMAAVIALPAATFGLSLPWRQKAGSSAAPPAVANQTFSQIPGAVANGPPLEAAPDDLLIAEINFLYATPLNGTKPSPSFRMLLQGDLPLGPFTITSISFAYYSAATSALCVFNAQLTLGDGTALSFNGSNSGGDWVIGVNADFTGAGITIDQFLQSLWPGAPTYYLADISLKAFFGTPAAYSLMAHITDDLEAIPSGDTALIFYFGQNYVNFAGGRSWLAALGPIDVPISIFDWVTIQPENFFAVLAPLPFTAPYLDTTIPFGNVVVGASLVGGTLSFEAGSAFTGAGEQATLSGLPTRPTKPTPRFAPRGLRNLGTAAPASQSNVVVPVQKNSCGINLQEVSFAWDGTNFTADITGGYGFGKVSLDAVGLTVAQPLPITKPPAIGLDGFAVQWGDPKEPPAFTGVVDWAPHDPSFTFFGSGALVLEKGGFTLLAAGGGDNLSFGFVLATGLALGGPSFNVTGLGVVFGSGCTLQLPSFATMASYPLVQAINPDGVNPFASVVTAQNAFDALNVTVDPTGQSAVFMIAIGAQSCGIANIAAIGGINASSTDMTIDLFGTVLFTRPFAPVSAYPATNVALGFEATVDPGAGLFSVTLQVLSGSWLINPALSVENPALSQALTGGAAFDLWYGDNPNAGDWVLTIGGYNPNVTVPPYYPVVPKVDWSIRPSIGGGSSLTGSAYATFCSSGLMFGAGLSAAWSGSGWSGSCDLSFDAYILFHGGFGADVNVQFSCSIQAHVLVHIDIEFSVAMALTVAASPFHGSFSLYVQGFSISHSFGDTQNSPSLTWPAMASAYLNAGAGGGAGAALGDSSDAQPLSIVVNAGVLPLPTAPAAGAPIVVHVGDLGWSVTTTIPILSITGLGDALVPPATAFEVAMLSGVSLSTSSFDVQVLDSQSNPVSLTLISTLQQTGAPLALWQASDPPPDNALSLAAIGITFALIQEFQLGPIASVSTLTTASPEDVTPTWLAAAVPTSDPYGSDNPITDLQAIASPDVAAARDTVLEWFAAAGFPVSNLMVNVGDVASTTSLYRADPLLRLPGEILQTESVS